MYWYIHHHPLAKPTSQLFMKFAYLFLCIKLKLKYHNCTLQFETTNFVRLAKLGKYTYSPHRFAAEAIVCIFCIRKRNEAYLADSHSESIHCSDIDHIHLAKQRKDYVVRWMRVYYPLIEITSFLVWQSLLSWIPSSSCSIIIRRGKNSHFSLSRRNRQTYIYFAIFAQLT